MEPMTHTQSAVLAGEDVVEFRRMRQEMYDLHRPRTGNEARCVEAMAAYEWGMARCRSLWLTYHDKLRALVHGNPDGTPEPHCERDPHRWHHSAMDCGLDAKRLASLVELERRKLERMQKLRRQNRLADAKAQAEVGPVVGPVEDEAAVVTTPDAANPEEVTASGVVGRPSLPVREDREEASPLTPVGRASLPDREAAATLNAQPPSDGATGKNPERAHLADGCPASVVRADFMVGTAEPPPSTTPSQETAHAERQPHPHYPCGQLGAPAGTAAVPAQAAEPRAV